MIQFLNLLLGAQKSKSDQRGASAVEYGLLVAGIAALIVAIVFVLGGQIDAAFDTISGELGGAGVDGGE
ncbi:Flp family type IVb pilin [Nocardioides zeae]|uniref:Flp family type IVb pilin n=1 Tax=Nocardioides imazamoxiresistens TaxID=3231893 RepID=A0ABU3PX24_9ACTN|nr:Flp family type IVb pilin [Nocardioides zeae]MDT9593793.1 Flp family type IVb pilin [Nocardioides zeae]